MTAFDPVQHRLDSFAAELCIEFGGEFDPAVITALLGDSAARLAETAAVPDFVPLLAYRFTKERLSARKRTDRADTKTRRDVVFVSLSGGGRGQIAAALATLLARDQVIVHSAGTAVHGRIDPAVGAAISELGIDIADAFARPITPEVLEATDVIITMGHSVGIFDIPNGIRHEDWRVGDPVGAPLDEVRRVRDDIEHRVRTLLASLNIQPQPPD